MTKSSIHSAPYNAFALVSEMFETARVVEKLDVQAIQGFGQRVGDRVLLTGEGSSRIFPAKKTVADSRRLAYQGELMTEGATQALEYDLKDTSVFVASNSGRTKEGVRLIRALRKRGDVKIFAVVAHAATPILEEADAGYVLSAGPEKAVAATKSVVEQALFYDLLFRAKNRQTLPDLGKLGAALAATFESDVPALVLEALKNAATLSWAGRNNGVAEELRLKTNEITRKKSDYLEGTYAVHGIEEVMGAQDSVVIVSPFAEEEQKFAEVLTRGAGVPVVAIATRPTSFPTFLIPDVGDFGPYVELVAGWRLLVEMGLRAGVDLDKPTRARKVGNEFVG